jgi:GalNAc-alpha-(1->4)-GalNAc-alpha-(1->3)-diNAcBac-PP-undecaprenol alpha-1,4-N-acetyl-D-galactosaminyltransferase
MKIAFVIPTLTAGGAERVAATLCNHWRRAGHGVHLVTFESRDQKSHYEIHPDIDIERLDLLRNSRSTPAKAVNALGRIIKLRRHLNAYAPDVTVSFMTATNVVTLLANSGAPWPTIVSERVHVPSHAFGGILTALRRWTYGRADAVIVQTKAMAAWAQAQLGIVAEVIPNPVDVARFRGTSEVPASARRLLVAVGRLDPQKGFDLLIRAFSAVASRLENWDLAIYGEGWQRPQLEALIKDTGMGDRISLPGVVRDIAAVYARADAIVHPARYEGYPNVIAEALAAGKPIVATNCPGGTSELLGEGKFGVLIATDDLGALQQALLDTLPSHNKLAELSCAARSANTLHEPTVIAERWISVFQRAIAARKAR